MQIQELSNPLQSPVCMLVIPALSVSFGQLILFTFFLLGYFAHLELSACRMICKTHLPFSFRIFAHDAGPISVLVPSHLPRTHLSLWYATALSVKYTQSYQPNSHRCVMLTVSPFMTVLGTSPLCSKTFFVVHDPISTSNSKQSFHSFFGELDMIIFLPAPFFSSLMVLSAIFLHGKYGSVSLT